ncbi:MAG: TIGR01777 family oxidoreductase [Holosporaceae bacterium]
MTKRSKKSAKAKHLLITGGTGFIGKPLLLLLHHKGYRLTLLVHRARTVDPVLKKARTFKMVDRLQDIPDDASIDGIINLAGTTVAKRWTKTYKEVLFKSRLETTENVIALIRRLEKKPAFLLNASGIYDHTKPTKDFAHELCAAWELCAKKAENLGLRVALMRFGVVLGHGGGALAKMLPLFRLGLGGRLGSGTQVFSWIHLKDALRTIVYLAEHASLHGAFNVVAPQVVSNASFTAQLANALHRPAFCHMPAFVVRLLFGEMGNALLLKGHPAVPKKLLEADFSFQFSTLAEALQDLFPDR